MNQLFPGPAGALRQQRLDLVAEINGIIGVTSRVFNRGLICPGAGRVAGQLMTQGSFPNSETGATDTGETLLALYDAGGNLHDMLNTTTVPGAVGATYAAFSFVAGFENDASGKTLRESGPYATSNPFRYQEMAGATGRH